MNDQSRASLRTSRRTMPSCIAIVGAVVLLSPFPIAGQTGAVGAGAKKTSAPKEWTAPHTTDGQPDLQGTWLSNSATPLERPKALEGRPFLTDDEVVELTKRADRIFRDGNSDFGGGDSLFLAALSNLD